MKFKINVKLGNSVLEVMEEASNFKDMFRVASPYQNLPTTCGNCESENLCLEHREIDGNEFFSVKCKDCNYEFKYGQKKSDDALFPKNWEAPFSGYDDDDDDEDTPKKKRNNKKGSKKKKKSYDDDEDDDLTDDDLDDDDEPKKKKAKSKANRFKKRFQDTDDDLDDDDDDL